MTKGVRNIFFDGTKGDTVQDKRINRKLYAEIILFIFLLSCIVFYEFVIYGHNYLFDGLLSDLVRVSYPVYCDFYDRLADGWSFWSWNMGIGTSALAHADIMFDPFTYLIIIFGKGHIADMMVWSLIAKLICEGLSIAVYLKYLKFNDRAVLPASVMYAFSGYSIIMGSNLALGTILVYFPLILLGIERLMREKKIGVLLASLFFTCLLSYYFFYISGILTVVYLIARNICQKRQLNILLVDLAVLAVLAVIAMGLSGFSLFPQLDMVRNSTRVQSSHIGDISELFMPRLDILLTAVLRSFSNDIMGNTVTGNYLGSPLDYFQLSTYTSAFCLILLFQAWRFMSVRQRNMVKWILFFVAMAVLFPFFSFAMNAFSAVNYRWMFFVNFLLALCIAFCLNLLILQGGGKFKIGV